MYPGASILGVRKKVLGFFRAVLACFESICVHMYVSVFVLRNNLSLVLDILVIFALIRKSWWKSVSRRLRASMSWLLWYLLAWSSGDCVIVSCCRLV